MTTHQQPEWPDGVQLVVPDAIFPYAGWVRTRARRGNFQAVVANLDGSKRVLEFHRCDKWEMDGCRFRCGLAFGDGFRCDQSVAVPQETTNQRIYTIPLETGWWPA